MLVVSSLFTEALFRSNQWSFSIDGSSICTVEQHCRQSWSDVLHQRSASTNMLKVSLKVLAKSWFATLYLSFVRPVCESASAVWHCSLTEEDANALERIQVAVAQRLLAAPWHTLKTALLEKLDCHSNHYTPTAKTFVKCSFLFL